jgi:hypothetical protein
MPADFVHCLLDRFEPLRRESTARWVDTIPQQDPPHWESFGRLGRIPAPLDEKTFVATLHATIPRGHLVELVKAVRFAHAKSIKDHLLVFHVEMPPRPKAGDPQHVIFSIVTKNELGIERAAQRWETASRAPPGPAVPKGRIKPLRAPKK